MSLFSSVLVEGDFFFARLQSARFPFPRALAISDATESPRAHPSVEASEPHFRICSLHVCKQQQQSKNSDTGVAVSLVHPSRHPCKRTMSDELGERRSSRRERKKPTLIYEVQDNRKTDDDDANDGVEDEDNAEESESNGDDDEEADARQFVSPKPKPRAKPNGTASRATPAKLKSAALVRPRKLKPVQEEGNGKSKRKSGDGEGDSDESDGEAMFFGTMC